MGIPSRRLSLLPLLLAMLLTLAGCATYRAHKGFAATDLSGLRVGMPRSEVEQILGKAEKTQSITEGSLAYYVYDRGYIPPAEEKGYSPVWTVPMGLILDAATLGAWGGSIGIGGDERTCQRGLLTVFYNTSGMLERAKTAVFWDKALSSILYSKRADHCYYVINHPRPSSLPDELKETPWPFDGPGKPE